MRTLEEVLKTPPGLLTDEEVNLLSPDNQAWVRNVRARIAAETACPGHERIGTGTREQANHGWHPAKCRHCGMDMSVDSGD